MNRDRAMFSNGTEFEMWQEDWCLRCAHQSKEWGGPCDDFSLVAVAELQIPEFIEEFSGGWLCTRYEVERVEGPHAQRPV